MTHSGYRWGTDRAAELLIHRLFQLYEGSENIHDEEVHKWQILNRSSERHQYVRVLAWWTEELRPWFFPLIKKTTTGLRSRTERQALGCMERGEEVVLTKYESIYSFSSGGVTGGLWSGGLWSWEHRILNDQEYVHSLEEFLDYGRRNLAFLTQTHFLKRADQSNWLMVPGSPLNKFRDATIFQA